MTTYWDYTGDYVEDWTDEELEEADKVAMDSYKAETDSYYWD